MAEITAEDLLARYNAGERTFQDIILSDVWLSCDGVNKAGENYGVNEAGGIELIGVDFSGAVFNNIRIDHSSKIASITFGTRFTNCNFTNSVWEFCEMPNLIGCNLEHSLMRGCYFGRNFTDCDWRYSRVVGVDFDDIIFERCDLREGRWSSGICIGFPDEDRGGGRGNFGIAFIDTLTDGLIRLENANSHPRIPSSLLNLKPDSADDYILF